MTAGDIDEVLGTDDTAQDDPFGTGDLAAAQYQPFSFTAKRLILAALVAKAISVVPTRDTQDVLKDFLVHVAPGSLQMAATDLELSVLASTPAVTTTATQTLVLPARKLLAILKESSGDDITVDVDGEFATVRAGTASWTLQLHDCGDYPPLPDPEQVEMFPVSREGFLTALRAVRHAVGRDSGRPQLQQVDIFVPDGGPRPPQRAMRAEDEQAVEALNELVSERNSGPAKVTACDSTRFARTVLPGFPLSMQIPAGALDSLVKTLESSELEEVHVGETSSELGQGFLVFRVGSTVFLASKLMARFPDVEKMLLRPALENRLKLTADKSELASAIRRVRINADPETAAIGLKLQILPHAGQGVPQGTLTVIARDKYGNRAQEAIAVAWEGPERLVVVNHQFLTEMLAAYPSQECQFWLGAEAGKKRSVLMLKDEESGTVGIIYQMLASLVGYGE